MYGRISIQSTNPRFRSVLSELFLGVFELSDTDADVVVTDADIRAGRVLVLGGAHGVALPCTRHGLIARIRALMAQPDGQVFLGGRFVLDVRRKSLIFKEKDVALTDSEAQLLQALFVAGPDGLAREALLSQVFGYGEGIETHTLETHVHRIRAKARELAGDIPLIMTVDTGYALAG